MAQNLSVTWSDDRIKPDAKHRTRREPRLKAGENGLPYWEIRGGGRADWATPRPDVWLLGSSRSSPVLLILSTKLGFFDGWKRRGGPRTGLRRIRILDTLIKLDAIFFPAMRLMTVQS